MAVAGKAAITMEGAWSSTKDYDRLCGVVHNNSLWISRKKPPIGVAPTDGEYWMLCIEGVNEQDLDSLANEVRNNYFKKTGGTLSGDVTIQKADNGHSKIFKNHSASADYGTEVADVAKDGRKSRLVLNASSGLPPQWYDEDGNGGSFYGVFNKPTANDVGALPLTGGTISDNLIIKKENYPGVKTAQTNSDYMGGLEQNNQSTNIHNTNGVDSVQLLVYHPDYQEKRYGLELGYKVDGVYNGYLVYGDHNKPFGTYTGNGSASARTISTGGLGRLLLVYKEGSDVAALVTPQGAFIKNLGEADGTQAASAYFVNGNFYIATTSAYFNQSGATYYYQVI